ncbi:MAG TPA: hypothetical protein VLX92_02945 [Kofleriaceae bacterium]|nr:hypothetical protein [Kofleriaceae bacterium]
MAGCSDNSSKKTTDAAVDSKAGSACTGLVYDSCNPNSSNCMTGTTCKTYTASAFSVCTPTCSATVPCPDQGTTAVTCNNMGLCKPTAPNTDCTSP